MGSYVGECGTVIHSKGLWLGSLQDLSRRDEKTQSNSHHVTLNPLLPA